MYLEVADRIRAALDAGEYPAGTLLPARDQLGALHGCSPMTLASALKVLEQEGRVQRTRGRAPMVRPQPTADARWARVHAALEELQAALRDLRNTPPGSTV